MADYYNNVTKQNITELLYKASLINNTDLQESIALSNLVSGIYEQRFSNVSSVQDAVNNGYITLDTYVLADGDFPPNLRHRFVDTAGNILAQY